jgi:hypothetical protein
MPQQPQLRRGASAGVIAMTTAAEADAVAAVAAMTGAGACPTRNTPPRRAPKKQWPVTMMKLTTTPN